MKNVQKYEMKVYWSPPDKAYIAEVPELDGCMADGPTRREAVAAAEEVIDIWIKTAKQLGRPIPKPRGQVTAASKS